MTEDLNRLIDQFIAENKENILWDITRLVGVPSVEEAPGPGAPFGPGPRKALDMAETIARELGLETVDLDHKAAYAVVPGERDEYLATICHVDVVPVGEGWTSDPWTVQVKGDYLIGRGVMDDKGPAVLTLYLLKFLKEHGGALRYPVRAILGANEETGMKDVDHYLAVEKPPLFCFSPDADFPLINGEKGIVHGMIRSAAKMEKIVEIRGGVAFNAVPSKAEAWVQTSHAEPAEDIEVEEARPGVWHITAHGIGGHASMPQGTKSAIGVLEHYLLDNGFVSENEAAFLQFAVKIPDAPDGSLVGCAADDHLFSPLTLVSGMIFTKDDQMVQTLDFRFPTNTDADKLKAALEEAAGGVATVEMGPAAKPFFKHPTSKELKACMEAYREVTGEKKAEPFTIGGGTYARHFPNAVGFGPEHPEREYPDFVGKIHGADEGAFFPDLLEALKVYITALLKLEEIEF